MKKPLVLKEEPTTIRLKKGTKQLLESLGDRNDSFDDIIRKLIRQVQHQTNNEAPEIENRLKISHKDTTSSSLLIDGGRIDFAYSVPRPPLDPDFRLRVTCTKLVYKGKERKIYEEYTDRKIMAEHYLRIIEQIIHQHIDPLFKIDEKHVLDLDWWKRQFKNLGFPDRAYETDVEFELIKLGVHP
ncbi:MAG: hypothetical protein V1725_08030 [archaeon]